MVHEVRRATYAGMAVNIAIAVLKGIASGIVDAIVHVEPAAV